MSFKLAKIIPELAVLPVKLNPGTEKTPSTSWLALTMAAARSITLVVYCKEAPGGACTMTKKYPWSSCGTKLVGTFWYTKYVGASPKRKTTTKAARQFVSRWRID